MEWHHSGGGRWVVGGPEEPVKVESGVAQGLAGVVGARLDVAQLPGQGVDVAEDGLSRGATLCVCEQVVDGRVEVDPDQS